MAVDGLGTRTSTYTPAATPGTTPAAPTGVGQLPAEAQLDPSVAAGQAFVDGKVKTGVVVDPNVLAEGAAVSPELLAQLRGLQVNSGAISGDLSALGDVDINVTDGPLFTFPSAEQLGTVAGGLDAVMASEDVALQGQVVEFLGGVGASLEFVQLTSGRMIFGNDFDLTTTRNRLGTFTGELGAQTGPTVLPFSAGATHSLNEQFLAKQPTDINAFVQWVLRESYLDFTEDLKIYADKVRFYNDLKKEIRAEMQKAREILRTCAGLSETDALPGGVYDEKTFDETYLGEDPAANGTMTDAELKAYNEELERQKKVKDEVENYNEALANAPTTDITLPGTTKGGHTASYNPDSGVGNATSNADQFAQELIDYYNDLSPAEKEAFVKELKEEGLTLNGSATDYDSWSSDETANTGDRSFDPMTGDDVEAYIKDCCSQLGSELSTEVDNAGSATPPYDFSFSMSSPSGKVEDVPDPSKADMSGVDLKFLEEQGYDVDGNKPLTVGATDDGSSLSEGGPIDTKGELEDYIDTLEDKLSSVGDDAQLANVDLQNILQKQQQVMQMMSNISKQLHDTALNSIRKIGG